MNLAQFQIILQKINALDKNISMDGKISSIEKDLMKAYVSQLYEACVGDESKPTEMTTPVVAAVNTPPTATEPTPVQEVQAPHVEAPAPQVQAIVTPEPTATPTPEITPEPVQEIVETASAPVATPPEVIAPIETPAPKAQNKLQDLNDRIAANTKTVADKLSAPQGKSLNERLAQTSTNKTFNDKFTTPEKSNTNTNMSAPKMVQIPDSIKHLDNSIQQAPQNIPTPTPTVTPPPPPAPVPMVNTAPAVKPVAASVNINEIHSLFDESQASEAAGKWGSTPIQDISKSIGLNDKISMIKELFNDDHHAFNNSLTQLNGLGSYNEAKDYMMRNLVTVFKWNEGNKLERAKQLINLVRRRYK